MVLAVGALAGWRACRDSHGAVFGGGISALNRAAACPKIIWAKKNFQWVLLNYRNRKIVVDQIQGFTWIKSTPEEKIARIHREDYYGIVSSSRGVLVPTNFTEIINLGSADVQLYFTEKHVEEAGIFVVVYFDKDGKFVRRQSYEEDEYEQILCGDH